MRTTFPFLIAAAMIAAPAAAQEAGNAADPAAAATTNDPAAMGATDPAMTDPALTAPTNGLTAGPGAAPESVEPMAVDTAYGEPAEREDDGFPWGVLGLLGLLGLIPRKPKARRHDGAI